jgi:outer membrane biosynthesis protein TonB
VQSIISPEQRPDEPVARSWTALVTSAVVHMLLMLWLLFRPAPAETMENKPPENGQTAQPIALPRPQENAPAQPPPPPAQKPQAPPRETPLGPDSKNPDAKVPKEAGPEKPMTEPEPTPTKANEEAAPPAEKPVEPVAETPPPAAPTAARRIPRASDYAAANRFAGKPTSPWGPPTTQPLDSTAGERSSNTASSAPAIREGANGRVGMSNRDSRDWRPSFPEAAGRCVSIPDLGKNADGTPVLATVIGRVFQADGRTPLAGAHLQIVGTAFATFSDATGEYRLEFDPKLLEQCRVQYVRVAADGFSGQMLTLAIGQRIRSDDVILRRH